MACLKCGRDVESEQVFCDECLLDMKRYPISPSAVVQLPLRKAPAAPRKISRRRSVSLEDQVRILKRRIWILWGVLIVTLALMLAMVYPTVKFFARSYYLRPGQNYSTVTPTAVPETTG